MILLAQSSQKARTEKRECFSQVDVRYMPRSRNGRKFSLIDEICRLARDIGRNDFI